MRHRRIWTVTPTVLVLSAALVLLLAVTFFLNRVVFAIAAVSVALVFAYCIWRFDTLKSDMRSYLRGACARLNQQDRNALQSTPMPVAMVSDSGELLWYNTLFRQEVLEDKDAFGEHLETVFQNLSVGEFSKQHFQSVWCGEKSYTVHISKVRAVETVSYLLYLIDNTQLVNTADEYEASRPVVLSLYIDNSEEVMQNLRDSERAQISGRVESVLEDWVTPTSGIFRKCGTDRFLALLEQRHLETIINNKFDVLDRVRAIQIEDGMSVTLSIGVGTGKTFAEAEIASRQALDMALGRGGDQAAVKTRNGFDFYGGLSKSVEKRTKVRTRVVASALQDLIAGSDMVLVMGHRYSDLDCLGAAVALTAVSRSMGKPAYTVYNPQTTLAKELVTRYRHLCKDELLIEVDEALPLITSKTLLIITDTHHPAMLDFPELYQKAESVAVIDHHRKMVEYIDDAVLFYHEPNASSASEIVAELIQYMPDTHISRLEAEALLSGIMLDTRSFVMKAGVRTFEAAAYLRKLGADTVEVKRMFSESFSTYQKKAKIMSSAQWYRNTAIAFETEGGTETRIAASQAADELLGVKDVQAAFALFADENNINISARSLGSFNVQLVMEAMGGGGHQTMAGALLPNTTLEEAADLLKRSIDKHLEDLEYSKSIQQKQNTIRH